MSRRKATYDISYRGILCHDYAASLLLSTYFVFRGVNEGGPHGM